MKDAKISIQRNGNTCCRQYTVPKFLFTKRVNSTFLLFFTETLNKISLIRPFLRDLFSEFSRHENALDIIKTNNFLLFTFLFHCFVCWFYRKKFKIFYFYSSKNRQLQTTIPVLMNNLKTVYIIISTSVTSVIRYYTWRYCLIGLPVVKISLHSMRSILA